MTLYDYCIETGKQALLEQWHPTKNAPLTPHDVVAGAHKRVWWICGKGHEWQAQIKSRTLDGVMCPICTNRVILVGDNDLATTHPEIAAQWHPKKNAPLTPHDVVAGAHTKAWWVCDKGHEWLAYISARTSQRSGCPVCTGKQVKPGFNDLASTNPEIAAQWHPTKNGQLTSQHVTPYSNRKVWWICDKGHEFQTVIATRTSGRGCPYCTNHKVLAGFNDLATVQPKIAAQWHPELNGELTPQMVTAGSAKMAWWICSDGHAWKARINSRAGAQKNGCPVCSGRYSEARQARYVQMILEQKKTKE